MSTQWQRFMSSTSFRQAMGNAPVWLWGVAGLGFAMIALRPRKADAAEPVDDMTVEPAPTQPAGNPPLLKLGSSGPWVSYLQSLLGLEPTGEFDQTTDTAVRTFQTDSGLGVDGKVGKMTWNALGVTTVASPSPGPSSKPSTPESTPGPVSPAPVPGNIFGLSSNQSAREQQIKDRLNAGDFDHEWKPITWTKNGHTAAILVSRRALALSDGTHRLIVDTSYQTAQEIADMMGACLLTTRVADEIFKQADVKLSPAPIPITSTTEKMIAYSASIDAKVGGADGLVANEGKDWIITRRFWLPPKGTGTADKLHRSANFGWYGGPLADSQSPGGLAVIQSVGLMHDMHHTDYSQLLRFMHTDSLYVDGQKRNLKDTLADPAWSFLLNDEGGTLPDIRHPDL